MEASAITSPTYNHVGSLFDYVLVIEREAVLDAVPTISDEDEDMLRDVALFCAPRGIDGTMAIGTRSQTACWTFVLVRAAPLPSGRLPCAAGRRASRKLRRPHPRVFVCACRRGLQTDLTGARRYGTCLAFCWPPAAPKDGGGRPSEVQSTHSLCLLSRVLVGGTARRLLRVLHDPDNAATFRALLLRATRPTHAPSAPSGRSAAAAPFGLHAHTARHSAATPLLRAIRPMHAPSPPFGRSLHAAMAIQPTHALPPRCHP